jgi:hypothetical protein
LTTNATMAGNSLFPKLTLTWLSNMLLNAGWAKQCGCSVGFFWCTEPNLAVGFGPLGGTIEYLAGYSNQPLKSTISHPSKAVGALPNIYLYFYGTSTCSSGSDRSEREPY